MVPTREMIEEHSIPEPNSGCWLWLGCDHGSGYGVLHVGRRRSMLAHRASYLAFHGLRKKSPPFMASASRTSAESNPVAFGVLDNQGR